CRLLLVAATSMPIHSQLLNQVTGWLPVRPFNEALTGPLARHTGADWRHLAVLAAWGVIGALVAVRRFRWDPRPEWAGQRARPGAKPQLRRRPGPGLELPDQSDLRRYQPEPEPLVGPQHGRASSRRGQRGHPVVTRGDDGPQLEGRGDPSLAERGVHRGAQRPGEPDAAVAPHGQDAFARLDPGLRHGCVVPVQQLRWRQRRHWSRVGVGPAFAGCVVEPAELPPEVLPPRPLVLQRRDHNPLPGEPGEEVLVGGQAG